MKTRVPHEQDSSFQGIGVEAKRASSGAWSSGRPPTRPKHPASPAQAPCCGSAGTEWLEPSPGFHDEPDLARTEGGFRCNLFAVIGPPSWRSGSPGCRRRSARGAVAAIPAWARPSVSDPAMAGAASRSLAVLDAFEDRGDRSCLARQPCPRCESHPVRHRNPLMLDCIAFNCPTAEFSCHS